MKFKTINEEEREVVITLAMSKKLKISLQQYAPAANLSGGRRGATGVVLSILKKFQNPDGTLDFEKLDKFLND